MHTISKSVFICDFTITDLILCVSRLVHGQNPLVMPTLESFVFSGSMICLSRVEKRTMKNLMKDKFR